MSNFDREWLVNLLNTGTWTVKFTKKDGTERKMLCTLQENAIPEEKKSKNTGKAKNDEVIPVFDIEKQEWRSFRVDSIVSVSGS